MARIALLTAAALLALGGIARGEALVPVRGDLNAPMYATAPPGDSRLFVVERAGEVRIVKDGTVQPTPFLTVPNVATKVERGLSSMAFAPDYAASGAVYVFTTLDDPGQSDDGQIRVVEYRRSASDPDRADPASARLVLARNHPDGNHYGGQLAFGPDGDLYVTMGDGGTGGANGQATTTTLGKVLRVDPHLQPGGEAYGIPPDNPFAGNPRCGPDDGSQACPEIHSYGLRNPFRASFDRATGELIIGDVGQSTWEEVDRGRLGANYGWDACEGDFAQGSTTNTCPIAQAAPFFAYTHADGCAVIAGYVVHDARLPALDGRYLYGDLCRADLRTLDLGVPGGAPRSAGLYVHSEGTLFSFGEDAQGCVYVMADNTVYRVVGSAGESFACPGPLPSSSGEAADGGGAGSTAVAQPLLADVVAPALRLSRARAQQLGRSVVVRAVCDEACDLVATGALRFAAGAAASGRLRTARAHAEAGTKVTLRLRVSRAQRARARRVRAGGGRASARVTVIGRDGAGNARRRSERIPLH